MLGGMAFSAFSNIGLKSTSFRQAVYGSLSVSLFHCERLEVRLSSILLSKTLFNSVCRECKVGDRVYIFGLDPK